MSSFDNEIYRGPPEAGPTLEHDIRSYGSDVYILKAEKNTLAQDVPPTEEPIRQEAKPVQKKESKIAKAMKLLASCTAAAAIAVNLTAPTPPPPIQKPESTLPEWPQYNYIEENVNGYSVNAISQHSNVSQASTGSKTYRITAKQEGLHLVWNTTYNIGNEPSREAFCLLMHHVDEGWFLDVSFHLYPQTDVWNENELLSQFTTPSGETFYLRTFVPDDSESTKERAADILSRLSDYIEISEATDDGWGKVLIGETMISDTNSHWNGILTTPEISTDFCFSRINQKQYADYTEDQFIRSLTINDIDWSFYYSFDEYSLLLWAVPAQEDIALASGLDFIMNDLGLTIDELQSDSKEVQAVLMDYLNLAVELAADICFSNYHLYDNPNPSPIHPVNPPDVPDETATVPAPDTGIEDYTYWSGCDFHFAGRSFIMEAMREDAMFREVYKGEDNIQFDLRVDYDDIRVLLIIGSSPNGGEYYPYVLDNGQELYVAAFNYWDNARILDEATLHTLARDFASYFKITETTEPEETGPVASDDPYSYLPEYTQYIVDSSGMSYSPYARSNRVCHFSTNGGNYRLESQSPDLFMLWENYYYDMKEESANSYITFNNIADRWSMGVWVFDEPVESVYDSFTLTAGDGTTLWFYIANFDDYSQQNNLEAILMKLPDILFLSRAKDGDWTKVLYGESLIVDVTSSWSGLAYTANNDNFWSFDQMIGVNDLQNHNLRFVDSRTVNGATWEFYTTGGSNGYGMTAGKEFYYTQVFAVPTGGDICFVTSLYNGLSMDQYEFSNQAEYETYIDANIHPAIDTIVSQGLSNFHLYTANDTPSASYPDPEEEIYDPYDYLPEYQQYLPTSDGGMSYSMRARSNRVCQFVAGRNAYRLEAQSPGLFIFWMSYGDESASSDIIINNIEENWCMSLWVNAEPVESVLDSFSMIAEDGTTLWFYIQHFSNYSGKNPQQSVISRMPELVKLSAAQDDGWGKIRVGETMIVNQTRYWSGFGYTVSGEDFWEFEHHLYGSPVENDLRFAGSREVNGIQWNFYTRGSIGLSTGRRVFCTDIFVVPEQEAIYLVTSLESDNQPLPWFTDISRYDPYYEAYLDENLGSVINKIVSQGLSNFYPYSE